MLATNLYGRIASFPGKVSQFFLEKFFEKNHFCGHLKKTGISVLYKKSLELENQKSPEYNKAQAQNESTNLTIRQVFGKSGQCYFLKLIKITQLRTECPTSNTHFTTQDKTKADFFVIFSYIRISR